MQNQEARLRSFAGAQIKTKGRGKSTSTLSWPLSPTEFPHLTPENLSQAGYYYAPTLEDQDQCGCFLCDSKLGGWDQQDDPFQEHYRRGKCGWAIAVCFVHVDAQNGGGKKGAKVGKERVEYEDQDLLPQSDAMNKARLKTFGKWWPHPTRGWLPTPTTMANAGFVYAPTEQDPDCVTCVYCDYSTVGWEPTDDPWDIHLRKRPTCPFFTARLVSRNGAAASTSAATNAVTTTASGTKRPASRATKAGKASLKPKAATTSSTTAKRRATTRKTVVDPVLTSESEAEAELPLDEPAEEQEEPPVEDLAPRAKRKTRSRATVNPTSTTARTTTRTRKTTTARSNTPPPPSPPAPAAARASDTEADELGGDIAPDTEVEEYTVPIRTEAPPPSQKTSTGKKRATRGATLAKRPTRRTVARASPEEQPAAAVQIKADDEPEIRSTAPRRATRKTTTTTSSSSTTLPLASKKATTKPKPPTRAKPTATSERSSVLESTTATEDELDDDMDRLAISRSSKPAPLTKSATTTQSVKTKPTTTTPSTISGPPPLDAPSHPRSPSIASSLPNESSTDATEEESDVDALPPDDQETDDAAADRMKMIDQGAREARSVMETLDDHHHHHVTPKPPTRIARTQPLEKTPRPTSTPPPSLPPARVLSPHKDIQLDDDQAEMTVVEYVRAMYAAKHDAIKQDGLTKIAAWEQRAREAREIVEGIPCRD